MTGCLRALLMAFVLLSFAHGHAQQFLPDTSAGRLAAEQTIRDYHEFMGVQSRIFNGTELIGYLPLVGFPYFKADWIQKGSIIYEGVLYRDVPMLYDLIKDQVIITDSSGNLIGLSGERISEFYLLGHHFIQTAHGFCDVLYSGPVTILAKRYKVIEESIENIKIVRTVNELVHYYAVEDGVYHPFSNWRSLLKLLKDKKKEILKDLRSKGIRYRKAHEQAFIEAADYYDHHSLAN